MVTAVFALVSAVESAVTLALMVSSADCVVAATVAESGAILNETDFVPTPTVKTSPEWTRVLLISRLPSSTVWALNDLLVLLGSSDTLNWKVFALALVVSVVADVPVTACCDV